MAGAGPARRVGRRSCRRPRHGNRHAAAPCRGRRLLRRCGRRARGGRLLPQHPQPPRPRQLGGPIDHLRIRRDRRRRHRSIDRRRRRGAGRLGSPVGRRRRRARRSRRGQGAPRREPGRAPARPLRSGPRTVRRRRRVDVPRLVRVQREGGGGAGLVRTDRRSAVRSGRHAGRRCAGRRRGVRRRRHADAAHDAHRCRHGTVADARSADCRRRRRRVDGPRRGGTLLRGARPPPLPRAR